MITKIGSQIGRRIKQLRKGRGLTQAQLADLAGKSVETISNFERGKTIASLSTLAGLARHLNVPIKEFFDDAPSGSPPSGLSSKHATTIYNALKLLPAGDLEIIANIARTLTARRRKKQTKTWVKKDKTRG